ncbi:MAG: sensor histidine kinase [Nitrospirae bacterium]|nr:MAG: sensor histidine kinase [Nitrospirota bacterium]
MPAVRLALAQPMPFGLKQKIILSILGAGALPLILGMVMTYFQGTTELERVIGGNFQALAGETARSIDLVLSGEIARRQRVTSNDSVIKALTARNARYHGLERAEIDRLLAQDALRWRTDTPMSSAPEAGPAQEVLKRFARTAGLSDRPGTHTTLHALFLTDAEGALLVSLSSNSPPAYRQADQDWWQRTYSQGKGRTYLGTVAFDDTFGSYVFTLAIPVMDESRQRVLGILQSVFDANEFFKPAIHPIRFGRTGHVMLIDSRGTVISCPILPTGVRVHDAALVRSVTAEDAGWVKASGDGHGGQATSIIGFAPLPETSVTTKASTGLLWHTFAWQSSQELFAPTRSLLLWIASAGLLAVGLLGSIGYYAAHRIVTPIRHLQEGAARIGRGELTEPLTIRTGDEIEQLADEFNTMNERLKNAFSSLEEKVAAKTAEVRSLKEYNEKILNSLPDSVVILTPDRTVEYINAEATKVFRAQQASILGHSLFDLLQVDRPTRHQLEWEFDHARLAAATRLEQGQEPRPLQSRDPLAPASDSRAEDLRQDIRIGTRAFGHRFFRVPSGNGVTRIGLALREVTSERLLQDQLVQAEKLAGMGTLTAGIAHEINNPLFVIMGLAQTLEEESNPRVTKEFAKDIVKYARHMASLIKNFARYTAPGSADEAQSVDVNQKLGDALKMARLAHLSNDLTVHSDYAPVPSILARPEEIQQVFLNIIINAIQAMDGQGTLRLSTEQKDGWVRIRIADTGPGIPQAFLGKIFDPFFTTKEPGKGTGLGLNIAYQLVAKYGGTIEVESEEGTGTTFLIHWPAETST